jgi:hypothetical protein
MPAAQLPEFLKYSPADVVKMGESQGLSPEQIAQGVINHRNNLEKWGRENGGEHYFNGALKLDNDTDQALTALRPAVQRQVLARELPDPVEQQKLAVELQKSDYDPDKLPAAYKPAVQTAMKAANEIQLPQEKHYGGKITAGGRDLANFRMRRAQDGMMDVGLTIPHPDDPMQPDSQAFIRVPHATAEDVKAEIKRRLNDPMRQHLLELTQTESPQLADIRIAAKQQLKPLEDSIESLKRGGPVALMNERVREELKKPEYRDTIGQYAGGTEFLKGLETAGISSAALFARVGQITGAPGADKTMRDLAEIQSTQDLRHGGSTRRALEGGLWNDSVTGAQQSLGQMAPFMVPGMVMRAGLGAVGGEGLAAAELEAQQAGRLGAAGAGMSASAAGSAELETQRKIDAAIAEGDIAKAERLRAGRDLHALLTGITEGAVERLGAGQTQNIFGGGVGHAVTELGKEGVEEVLTGGLQRGAVDPLTLNERPDVVGPMPQELVSGMMAAVPLSGGSALANWNQRGNDNTVSNPQTAPQPAQKTPADGVPPFNPFDGSIQPPQQRNEAGEVVPTAPGPVPTFQDDPLSTLAPQPAGGNLTVDYGIQRTPEAQAAYEQRQREYAQSQATAQGQLNQSLNRMPLIPDNPLGYRDILDYINDNPLHIPTKGSEAAKSGEYDWTAQYEMPKYYRKFLASSERGHSADVLAQMAHDEGYISQPTPDALMEQIHKTIRERTQHRVEFRRQQQDQADVERRQLNFDKAQAKASPVESQTLRLDHVLPGDEFTLQGEEVRVRHVEHDEDGTPTLVQIEDGKKFGILNLDPQTRGAILVDEFRPKERNQGGSGPAAPNAEEDPFMPAPRRFPTQGVLENARAMATGQQPVTIPAGMQGLMNAAAPGGGTQGQAGARGVEKLFSMDQPQVPVEVSHTLIEVAHEVAARGSSTQMVPIKSVYEAAARLLPGITPEAFMEAVQEGDHSGRIFIEAPERAETVQDAGPFVLRNALGVPSTNMMLAPQQESEDLAMPDDETAAMPAHLQRPAVRGPLPSNYNGAQPSLPPSTQPWSGRVRTLKGIRDFLVKSVGLPAIGVGRFKRALGIYRVKPESIRLQAINDIPVLSHEIGHAIHFRVLSDAPGRATTWGGRFDGELVPLGRPTSLKSYTRDMVRKEGVAEFVRLWLTVPATARAQAPVFSGFFESEMQQRNPTMAAALQEAQSMVADYVAMPEFEKAKAQIVFDPADEKVVTSWGDWLRGAYAKWVDTLSPALRVAREAADMNPSLEATAKRVEALMENHRGGWSSKAHADVFGNQTDLKGNRIGEGLKTILSALQPGDHEAFSAYIALKRAAEIEAQGKRSGFENAHLPPAEMQILEARFEAVRQKLLKWSDNELQLLIDGGILDAQSATAMRQANQDYVPFYRLYEKLNNVSLGPEQSKNSGGYVDLNSGIRRLKGSDRAILDPLQSLMKNAFMFRKIAEQNNIGVQFFELIRQVQGHGKWGEQIQPKPGMTEIKHAQIVELLKRQGVIQDESDLPANADLTLRLFEAITKPDTGNGEVIIFKAGKREHWQIKDPLLMEALKTADADAVKLWKFFGPTMTKLLTLPTRVLRFGATGGPWFAIPNFIRDQFTAGLQSKSGFIPFWDGLIGAGHVLKDSDVYQRWIEAGGKFHGITTGNEALHSLLEDALPKDTSIRATIQEMMHPRNWMKLLGAAGQIMEEATRVQEFNRMMQQGASAMEAANASKIVSMNFARAGERGRALNMLVAFANAQIQQLDMVVNGHRDPTRRMQTILKGVMLITVPSLLCWYLGKDDEEIQNLPDWRKNLFWNLNLKPVARALGREGFVLSIPKPFLMGAIYGTSVEHMLDYATDRDPNGWRKALGSVIDQTIAPLDMAMSLAGLRPLAETKMNYDFFRKRPVVPEQMQNLPASQQYDLNTSQTARLIGGFTNQSPMMIDHLVSGYFATAGKWGTSSIDWGLEKLGIADVPPPPRKDLMELPILNRFAATPYAANAWVDRFYKASGDMEGLLRVWRKQADQMTSREQAKWWEEYGPEVMEYSRTVDASTGRTGAGDVRKALKALSEINAAMKEVQQSRVLSPEDKRSSLMELAKQRNMAAEQAYKTLFPQEVQRRHF